MAAMIGRGNEGKMEYFPFCCIHSLISWNSCGKIMENSNSELPVTGEVW